MLAVVKAPHIDAMIVGEGVEALRDLINRALPGAVVTFEEDDFENASQSEWFRNLEQSLTPGDVLAVRRDNAGITQARLSELTGLPESHISGMETGSRPIGKKNARKLASAFGTDYREYL